MLPHKKHRNILYSIVFILTTIQIISFVVLSFQISNLNVKLETKIQTSEANLREFTINLQNQYDEAYQQNFNEISSAFSNQQENFKREIKMLKSSQQDFTGIVEEAIKKVVTVTTEKSMGSGFFIHPDGYIVTNNHVIAGQENDIMVLTYDKGRLPADLIGRDELKDIALLKISGEYDYFELANSDDLQIGKKVIAIGNPLGLSFTVTEGIISGLERVGPNNLNEYVQTDVSLNPGNSGGPLIDTTEKVVGINNFKIGGAESLGFALQSNSLKESVNAITNATLIQ